jgi:hypothetical protein
LLAAGNKVMTDPNPHTIYGSEGVQVLKNSLVIITKRRENYFPKYRLEM